MALRLPPIADEKPHDLDFDYPDFLTFNQLPPNEYPMRGWVFLCTIIREVSTFRPLYIAKDTSGKTITLAFYLENEPVAKVSGLKPGYTLSMFGAVQHHFLDGQLGIRIEDNMIPNLGVRLHSWNYVESDRSILTGRVSDPQVQHRTSP